MARRIGPVCKLCRREGEKLFLKGGRCLSSKCAIEKRAYAPGQHGVSSQYKRGRASDYSVQLREKQKVRRIYGVLERQFRRYFRMALRTKGMTGAMLLIILERRLDNVLYRAGFADSRAQARQLVQHGLIDVNGHRSNASSMLVKASDVVSVHPSVRNITPFKNLASDAKNRPPAPQWLSVDLASLAVRVVKLPLREEIVMPVNEQLVVEYYSR